VLSVRVLILTLRNWGSGDEGRLYRIVACAEVQRDEPKGCFSGSTGDLRMKIFDRRSGQKDGRPGHEWPHRESQSN